MSVILKDLRFTPVAPKSMTNETTSVPVQPPAGQTGMSLACFAVVPSVRFAGVEIVVVSGDGLMMAAGLATVPRYDVNCSISLT
ncbi:hypothetical protein D3C81_2231920 [compost metagenome]